MPVTRSVRKCCYLRHKNIPPLTVIYVHVLFCFLFMLKSPKDITCANLKVDVCTGSVLNNEKQRFWILMFLFPLPVSHRLQSIQHNWILLTDKSLQKNWKKKKKKQLCMRIHLVSTLITQPSHFFWNKWTISANSTKIIKLPEELGGQGELWNNTICLIVGGANYQMMLYTN